MVYTLWAFISIVQDTSKLYWYVGGEKQVGKMEEKSPSLP